MRFGRGTRQRQRRPAGTNKPRAKYYQSSAEAPSGSTPFRRGVKRSKRSRVMGRLFDVATLAGILILFGYSLVVRPPVKVLVSDEAYHTAAEYEEAANAQLSALKNKNKVTFDEQGIAAHLKKDFPEIADLQISLPLVTQQPALRVAVYAPTLSLSSQGETFIIDSQGRAVGQTADFTNLKSLIAVNDESNFKLKHGQPVLAASAMDFIVALDKHLKKSGIAASGLALPAQPQELILRTADRPYLVKFLLSGDPSAQIGQYLAARVQFDQDGSQPSDYLDVRVPGKVFYK